MARQSLIDKGLVEAAGRGRLRFTMPGFASFVTTLAGAGDDDLRPCPARGPPDDPSTLRGCPARPRPRDHRAERTTELSAPPS
ncbi:hypothetical protein FXW78_22705 [Rhodococcus opacus]|nr:hypothetical protein [Rhodococcus opacus]